ncbi:signal peptidase I [Psychromicrobium xiongbiense]|uniref:signal peptidase I n=1 Tax=Psychromicrobium xiongbiense TaxID=3051184 RepID=UPI002556FE8D|nr:signal peptidase I [Psychromicrobium sp. YIM S02556]
MTRVLLRAGRETVLTVLALLGLACLAALVLGFFVKASFVVFRTGSMEPLYPVGALSLTVQEKAQDLQPGDVVSVKRTDGGALVTHRVVRVSPLAAPGGTTSLTLKGDANTVEDPLPYEVTTAQKVVLTVPSLGGWIMAARGPWFIGAATPILATLVVWAFWPRRSTPDGAEPNGPESVEATSAGPESVGPGAPGGLDASSGVSAAGLSGAGRHWKARASRGVSRRSVVAGLLLGAMLPVGWLSGLPGPWGATPAHADDGFIAVPETGIPGYVSLASSRYPLEFPALTAGNSFSWQVRVSLSSRPTATASLQLTAQGSLGDAWSDEIAVEECAQPWQGSSGLNQVLACPGGGMQRVASVPLSAVNSAVRVPLADLHQGSPSFLKFTLKRPAQTAPAQTASSTSGIGGSLSAPSAESPLLKLGIGVTGLGDDPAPGELGVTGAELVPAVLAGLGLVALGSVGVLMRGRHVGRHRGRGGAAR